MVQGTFFENRRLKKAMANFLYELDASYFVTANFNRDTNYAAARRTLSAWHARIDKALLGGSWSRKARNERTFFIACVGHIDSNLHWHWYCAWATAQSGNALRLWLRRVG